MTTETNTPETGDKKNRSGLWILLLVLLVLLIGAVYWFFLRGDPTEVGDGSEFSTQFEGCDDAGNCAQFTIYAPGRAYAWDYRRAVPVDVDASNVAFGAKISERFEAAEAILVAGLASQEGDRRFNERLSTCRARAFEGIVISAREAANSNAPIFRLSLGQYQAEDGAALTTASAADGAAPGANTQIQRVMVLAFVSDIPEGIDLAQALRNGAQASLTDALQQLRDADGDAVADQLQFQRYSCWNDLEATALGDYAQACYGENPSLIDTLCAPFN